MQVRVERLGLANAMLDADLASMHHHRLCRDRQQDETPLDSHGPASPAPAEKPSEWPLQARHDGMQATSGPAGLEPVGLAANMIRDVDAARALLAAAGHPEV